MISYSTLMGGAGFYSLSGDLALGLGHPKVLSVNANGHKLVMPDEHLFPWNSPVKYIILNVGASAFYVEYPTTITHTYYNIIASSADNSFNSSAGGLAIVPPGGFITTSGFSNGANNGLFQVTQRFGDGTKICVASTLVNETVNVTPPVPPATTPLPPVAVSRVKAVSIQPGNVATFMLGTNGSFGAPEWYVTQRAYNFAQSIASITNDGSPHSSICTAIPQPPPPPPPPPPYDGEVINLSGCPATKTVTISGGLTIWNGVFTVTLNTATVPPYYRYVLDSNHWILLRYFPGGGGYGYQWQVILDDLTGASGNRRRFGNNTAGSCPPNGTYTCFPVISENSFCYAPAVGPGVGPGVPDVTCVVST